MKSSNLIAAVTYALAFALLLPTSLMGQSVSKLMLEHSTDMQTWQAVPMTPEMLDANGELIFQNNSAQQFFRMRVNVLQLPNFTTQPASNTAIGEDESATLSVNVTGVGLSYQWYSGQTGDTTQPIAGANSAAYITDALTEDKVYWVRVTNAAGIKDSGTLAVTINRPPTITTQPISQNIASGSTASMTVETSGTGPFTYQWYRGNVGTTSAPVGTNSGSYTTPPLAATTRYWVNVSNVFGFVSSSLCTITIGAQPPADMALIPAGSFTMGDSLDGDSYAPPVTVNVSAFLMGKNEVTKALWDEVRTWGASNGYNDLAQGAGKAADHPAQTISWWDVVKWCNARSQKEGLTPVYTVSGAVMKTGTTAPSANWSANGYRLPTEAEWEKAARGGLSGKRFPWGDTISHSQANYYALSSFSYDLSGSMNNYHPSYATGSTPYTSPVGAFAANAYGLHDMAGNVWEWCWDWYGASTYSNASGATDPRGANSGSGRVGRGGGWGDDAFLCRVALRYYDAPTVRNGGIGFRVARSSVP